MLCEWIVVSVVCCYSGEFIKFLWFWFDYFMIGVFFLWGGCSFVVGFDVICFEEVGVIR